MPLTPERFHGPALNQEGIILEQTSSSPTTVGEILFVSGSGFQLLQNDGITMIRSGNINSDDHKTLRQLAHLVDESGPLGSLWNNNLFNETGPKPFMTASIWWSNTMRTHKIVEQKITRLQNKMPATIQWIVYAENGLTILESHTDTITYDGLLEISRIRSQP